MTYKPHPIQTEGNKKEVVTSDDNVQSLLCRILKELKIMNVHLSLLTDNWINSQEVE